MSGWYGILCVTINNMSKKKLDLESTKVLFIHRGSEMWWEYTKNG